MGGSETFVARVGKLGLSWGLWLSISGSRHSVGKEALEQVVGGVKVEKCRDRGFH